MTIVNGDDKILRDYIDNKLDNLNIKYKKTWQNKYNKYVVIDCEPMFYNDFIIIYKFDCLEAMRYKDKIAQEFIDNREYLEKCLSI